jgi:hypothetical protein
LSGKLSDSTAKLLEDMAKRSGLALKQINEVRVELLSPHDILPSLRAAFHNHFTVKASIKLRSLASIQTAYTTVPAAHGEQYWHSFS